MRRAVHRAIVTLMLPAAQRARFGADMAALFDSMCDEAWEASGLAGVTRLWMRETVGLVRFGWRARIAAWRAGASRGGPIGAGSGPDLPTQFRWAWRGIRGRGWRAAFVAGLLAVTLTATAATFAIVDAVLLQPYPFPGVDRIVDVKDAASSPIVRQQSFAIHDAWQVHRDVFSAVGTFLTKNVFITTRSGLTRVATADVTVELFDVLGVAPKWGRAFAPDDLRDTSVLAAMVSEGFAREQFGRPDLAVGQRIEATGAPLAIVGVLPEWFAFPMKQTQVWRVMALDGPLTENFGRPRLLARLAPGVSPDRQAALVSSAAAQVGEAAGVPNYAATASARFADRRTDVTRTMLFVLLGAACCLLLAASANMASLELAHAADRTRVQGVHVAMGATRAAVVRVAVFEGLIVLSSALASAIALTHLLIETVVAYLPPGIGLSGLHRIGLDSRVVLVTMAAGTVAWLLGSVMPVVATTFAPPRQTLALAGRTSAGSPTSVRLRRVLTVVEVAVGVVLVVGGVLYARTYRELLMMDKGFDSAGLVVASVEVPAYYFSAANPRTTFQDWLVAELTSEPGILGVTRSGPPPGTGDSPAQVRLEFDGRPVDTEPMLVGRKWVDDGYFDVTRIPVRRGRVMSAAGAGNEVVIPESLARRLSSNDDVVGHTITGLAGPGSTPGEMLTIVGVVGDVRTDARHMPGPSDRRWDVYQSTRAPVLAGIGNSAAPRFDNGGFYSGITVTARVASRDRVDAIASAFRRADPSLTPKMVFVDDEYAAQHAATLLTLRVVGVFSAVSWFVAMAGLYAVMSFLVVARTREIGIRMALGATPQRVQREVLRSSGRLVGVGLAFGAVAAWLVAQSLQSQLFGVSPADPITYLVVATLVGVTALAATWEPAARAARTDPAITLRSE